MPAGWRGRHVLLRFGGVWSSAEVWLNGEPLGRIDAGFNRLTFDTDRAIRPGARNRLAVRVRQVQPSYLFDVNDDWSLGGIYRSVTLEAMPGERWLDAVAVETDFDDAFGDADLKVRVMVGDRRKRVPPGNFSVVQGEPYRLRLALRDDGGRAVAEQELAVPPHQGTGRESRLAMHVAAPRPWTAETPYLYRLGVELVEGDTVVHRREVAVGFREITTGGGVLRVNGQAVKLRGVNRHDEHPATGRATTPAQWREDLLLMKRANINYVRLAHYPPAEGFLDLCDRLGMYVSDEVPMGSGGDRLDDPSLAGPAMLRSYEAVQRDANHPSVIIWSVGNEDPLTSLHLASVRAVKALDPTRPVLMP